SLPRAICAHDADQETPRHLLGEGDEIPTRRPNGCGIAALPEADAPLAAAVVPHHIELLGPIPIRFERDVSAVWAVARPRIDGVGLRQAAQLAAAQIHLDNRRRTALADAHYDALPVRGEARPKAPPSEISAPFP